MGLETIHLVGWSLGASVALNYAAHHPSRIKTLTLLGAPNLQAPINRPLFDQRLQHYAQGGTQTELVDQTFGSTRAMLSERSRQSKPEVVELLYQEQLGNSPQTAERVINSYVDRPDFAHILARVRCQVHIIVGDEDPICGAASALELKEQIPQIILTPVAHCGHYYALEQPALVARAIEAGFARMAPKKA